MYTEIIKSVVHSYNMENQNRLKEGIIYETKVMPRQKEALIRERIPKEKQFL